MGALSAAAVAAGIQFLPPQSTLLSGAFLFRPPSTGVGVGGGGALSIGTRTQTYFPQRRLRLGLGRLLFFQVKSAESSSTVDIRTVPSNVLTTEKEAAKAVLTMFLKKEIGLSNEATAGTISNAGPFIDHLVARLHSIHKSRYLAGRELTTLEVRDALIPYLEHLCEEHTDSLDDVVKNFRNPPEEELEDHRHNLDDVVESFSNPPEEKQEQHISEASPTKLPLNSKKLKAMARMTEIGTNGQLHPNTLYLVDIGLDMNQIKQMARKYPWITNPCWGRHARSLVEFLSDLGVPPSDIPNIIYKTPSLFGLSLSENIIPSMAYLETLGMDKSNWAKVIKRSPSLLLKSKQKMKAVVDYLYELGLPKNKLGKCLERCPQIMDLSIDNNLRPTADYFRSMGVNLTSLLSYKAQVLCLSVECKLNPVTEFFLDKGYSIDEIGSMASRFGSMYCYSLTKNLIPKWDFFLTMDYSRSKLVTYPHYFGFSLEGRIKPRYSLARECGVKLSFGQLFYPSDSEFEKLLKRSMKKVRDTHLPSTIP